MQKRARIQRLDAGASHSQAGVGMAWLWQCSDGHMQSFMEDDGRLISPSADSYVRYSDVICTALISGRAAW